MALTVFGLKNLKKQDKLYMVADSGGLCIAVSPSGGKLWRYRFNGNFQMLPPDKFPDVGLLCNKSKYC